MEKRNKYFIYKETHTHTQYTIHTYMHTERVVYTENKLSILFCTLRNEKLVKNCEKLSEE